MILAVDQGTSQTTCLVFDDQAELVGRAADDLSVPAAKVADSARKPWKTAAFVALALPVIAFGTYFAVRR